jgi:hypothetical protein
MYIPPEMARRLDELVRRDLQDLRDSYFLWLLIATAAVLVGILMEGPEVARDLRDAFRSRRKRDLHIAERPHPFWVLLVSSIGWVLISSGVVGEGIFEGLASKADGLLQTFNDALLASASDRASNAEVTAKALESQIAGSAAFIKSAEAQAAFAKAEAAKAQLGAAQARLELAKLQEKMADRNLSAEQWQQIANGFKSAKFTTRIAMAPLVGNGEAARYSQQISSALALGGATIANRYLLLDNALLQPIWVCTNAQSEAKVKADATVLRDILHNAGIDVNTVGGEFWSPCIYPEVLNGDIGLLIPAKPK